MRSLEEIGDSVLVVGDERTLRVHVHTDEPETAVALFEPAGEVSRLDVADMREQVADRSARLGGAPEAAARDAVRRAGGGQRRGHGPPVRGARRPGAGRRADA